MVNTDGTDLHRLTAATLASPMYAHWSPDGSHLLFTGTPDGSGSADEGLWTIDADGTGLTPIITGTGGRDQDADWSPDGSRIVFTHFDATGISSLRVMNADGSGVTTLLSDARGRTQFVAPDWGQPDTPGAGVLAKEPRDESSDRSYGCRGSAWLARAAAQCRTRVHRPLRRRPPGRLRCDRVPGPTALRVELPSIRD